MKTSLRCAGRRRRTRTAGHLDHARTRPTAAMLLTGLVLAVGGCRSYERQPLDIAATREAWLGRSPADESALAFAERLARAEGSATAFDPSDGLTLGEAEPVALVFNRDLRLARLDADVTRAAADLAGLWDDPVAGVDIERIVSGVPDPWVAAGTVGLTIPLSGRLAVEKDRADARLSAELQRLVAREWATRAALRELWIEWSAQMNRLRLATDLAERLGTVVDLAQRQEQAGAMSRIDARLFNVELAGNGADIISARARARELELQLRDILGLAPGAPVRLVETIAFAARGIDPAWVRDAMEGGNAELAAVRSEYEVAEQSLRLEVRRQYPDLTIGPGYGIDEGDDRVLLGLRIPLPLWSRNRQAIAEAAAGREVARARFDATYEHLASRLAIAQTRYEAGRAMREAVESRVLPLADEQDADVRRVAELGRVDPLLLLQALQSQHAAKVRLVDATAAESVGAIRLDELIGPPAPTPAPLYPETPPAESQSPTEGGRP